MPPPVNGLAIAALVLGFLCFLPLVGLVLGVIALAQIKKRGERGRGLAIGGIAVSAVGALLLALFFATGGARSFWEGFEEAARGSGTTFSLEVGECFTEPSGSLEGYTYDVDTVPCSAEHDGEVFSNVTLPDRDWPGDDAVAEVADERCYELADTYVMDRWAWPSDVDVYYFTPTRESWEFGDREITCMFAHVDVEGSLTGSLRADGTTLDADQLAYLEADAVLYEALATGPSTEQFSVEGALEDYKGWASRIDEALGEQIGMLRGHEWPADAAEQVAAHVEALEDARAEWAEAALAGDADAFHRHYDQDNALVEGPATVTARKALGLATTPPVYEDEWSEGDGAGGDGADGPGTVV
ncbi:DUF4190 domain-containing protein [Streptomyces sp. CRN 30]|uniref:DUF4190 domain-containing protein n=1 Tax=Streptomyces sp. CRN 30 TaxID=3075613 RepID=UPI002A807021|nr:DUF4190 domain-containing protein [Streptomyces sp. CRN 30]